MPTTHTDTCWCQWCRRWIYPRQHIGPGWHCPACRGHLGTDLRQIANARPGPDHREPVEVTASRQYTLGLDLPSTPAMA